MPIHYPSDASTLSPPDFAQHYTRVAQLSNAQERSFLFFFSSETDGSLWCPYCRDILPAVEDVFGGPDKPDVFIQYTGQRAEWKDPQNPLRSAPYGIKGVPTLVAFEDGKEVARLSGGELQAPGGLQKFVRSG